MNLTPTQKADELIEKFKNRTNSFVTDWRATQCAIIAVEEILIATARKKFIWKANTVETVKEYSIFWQEVKTILTDRL